MSALLIDNNIIKNNNITKSNLNIPNISYKINSLKINNKTSPSKEELEFLDIINKKVIKKVINNNFNNNNINKGLILDSSTSEYYTPYKDYLLDYKPVYNKSVIIANGVKLPIKGIGNIPIFINKDILLIKNV